MKGYYERRKGLPAAINSMNDSVENVIVVRRFDELARSISSLAALPGGTTAVSIDGCAGSGKSTFARKLAKRLPNSSVVQVDDFASWENPLGWWPRMLDQVLRPFSEGKPAHYQRYDWDQKKFAEWRTVKPEILIVEGVSSIRCEFHPYLSYKIWLECPNDVRLKRGLARDGEDALPLWEKWRAEESAYVHAQNPRSRADLTVDGNPTIEIDFDEEFIQTTERIGCAIHRKNT